MDSYRVLVTGGSGLLGRYLRVTSPLDISYYDTAYSLILDVHNAPVYRMDVTNFENVVRVFSLVKPNVVIHTAACADVDFCERFKDLSSDVNVHGTNNIIHACNMFGSKLVFMSTNAVFDGTEPPYNEFSRRNPLSEYGLQKERAEDAIAISGLDYLIVRTMWLYGKPYYGARGNWVTKTIEKLTDNQQMRIVSDVINQPTYAGNLSDIIWKLIDMKATGIYHVAGNDAMSLYDFVMKVVNTFNLDASLVSPANSDEFSKGYAARPSNTTFDMTKLNNLGIITWGVDKGLENIRA